MSIDAALLACLLFFFFSSLYSLRSVFLIMSINTFNFPFSILCPNKTLEYSNNCTTLSHVHDDIAETTAGHQTVSQLSLLLFTHQMACDSHHWGVKGSLGASVKHKKLLLPLRLPIALPACLVGYQPQVSALASEPRR